MILRVSAGIAIVIICSGPVSAAPVTQQEVSRAQGAMLIRVQKAVAAYAQKIGIDASYVSYCQSELDRKTDVLPSNGLIPFGVDYNSITDSDNLKIILDSREAYERSSQILCLARAKASLKAASQP